MLKIEWNAGDGWHVLNVIPAHARVGSMTNRTQGGQEIIFFQCETTQSVIMRIRQGISAVTEDGRITVAPGEPETLAELKDGESYERTVVTDREIVCCIRWTHLPS